MIHTFNFTNLDEELAKFKNRKDMKDFAMEHGCCGIELQMFQNTAGTFLDESADVTDEDRIVHGIHLKSWNNWMDMWLENEEGLIKEFDNLETAVQYYGGFGKQGILEAYERELEEAQRLGVKYVVFHVSECTIPQLFGAPCPYSDEEVAEASCRIINSITKNKNYTFDFLMENLWWKGMSFRRPEIAKYMMENVEYENKGFMLDTGHLMNSNRKLRSFDEAVDFIYEVFKPQEDILPYIKGIHLNGSLSGEYVENLLSKPVILKEKYWDRWCEIYNYIFNIDRHEPFDCHRVGELVKYLNPKYITHELISKDREDLGKAIDKQMRHLL